MMLAFLVTLLGVPLGAYQWLISISTHIRPPPFLVILRLHWLGVFSNHFLPSAIGGDVVKGIMVSRRTDMGGIQAAATLVISRLTGLWGLFLVFVSGAVLVDAWGPWIQNCLPLVVLLGVVTLVPLFPPVVYHAVRMLGFMGAVGRKAGDLLTGVEAIRTSPHLAMLIFVGVVFQLLVIMQVMLVFQAIQITVPITVLFIVVPICGIAWMLPISINGLGVREFAFVLFFGDFGIGAEEATLASLMVYVLTIIVSLPGGLLLLLSHRKQQNGQLD
jgi:uncharacterized membrane protein YbhN (UPF0104 family)